ncbi:hypothetical protein Aam_006_004 [Acidocella aminolytica 101 = DSM 11237]|jgi:hypothetical protein|uniref:Uncharacterized protein n=1 Tax=Acidocella aminolytica 101 = DSM 11237 TaxID=1120923 RepID=A0A0D6PAB9_9PROT|nr:hypothetical protein Aam_006_004 [Acidocella aminolytica 101 = DSM 11237]GBQ33962.1 hypothetical protein AA11237_0630 [Acidocella aminolytica 101 = DSM 11237]
MVERLGRWQFNVRLGHGGLDRRCDQRQALQLPQGCRIDRDLGKAAGRNKGEEAGKPD